MRCHGSGDVDGKNLDKGGDKGQCILCPFRGHLVPFPLSVRQEGRSLPDSVVRICERSSQARVRVLCGHVNTGHGEENWKKVQEMDGVKEMKKGM